MSLFISYAEALPEFAFRLQTKAGLTGYAQINGRDELEIPVKAKFDGEYARAIKKGGFHAFGMDVRCFFLSLIKVFKKDGVVEGGTGKMNGKEKVDAA